MKNLTYIVYSFLLLGISTQGIFAQEHSPISFRLHLQPQVSSFNPIDQGFISTDSQVSPTFAFGLEATRNLSKHLEISLGYHHSTQAGKYEIVWCDAVATNLLAPTDSRTRTLCPLPREKARFIKIPISLGWRIIENKKYMSRLSFGPQLQISLDRSTLWLSGYNRYSAAFMTEWSNYFRLSKNLSLVSGLRVDRSFTPMDADSMDRTFANSFGLVMGLEYTIWTEKK